MCGLRLSGRTEVQVHRLSEIGRGEVCTMSSISLCRWYVLHVRVNYEEAVAHRLRELGIREYLPYRKQPLKIVGDRFQKKACLFPGYVFCNLDLRTSPKLYNVAGVIRILGQAMRPTPLEDDEIMIVQRIVDSSLPVDACPYLHPADLIEIVAGPLTGVRGTFLRHQGARKLVVSLPLLQRSLAVTIRAEWVRPDPSAARASTESQGDSIVAPPLRQA